MVLVSLGGSFGVRYIFTNFLSIPLPARAFRFLIGGSRGNPAAVDERLRRCPSTHLPFICIYRLPDRHGGGGLAGYRPPHGDCDTDSHNLRAGRYRVHHYAVRHLLRCYVRRHHHLGADQYPRRSSFGGHLHRGLPDGEARAGEVRPLLLPPLVHSSAAQLPSSPWCW